MKIVVLLQGKTKDKEVQSLCGQYYKRLKKYVELDEVVVPDLKNLAKLSADQVKEKEWEKLQSQFQPHDFVVFLDEKGKTFSSVKFANHVQQVMNRGYKRIVFVVGGPYGFSADAYARCDEKLSLSAMTFSHQIIRAIFAEQIYRCFSILNNDPYHNE